MGKILKPYTIIPSSLYVSRDADRQIESIIQDMGRPGYVLVSRQMGKTNLLLNVKRNLESPNDVFVYIDLSNPYETAKSCFENIVDSAIETNFEKFQNISLDINSRRKELIDTPPHKQHTNELRLLLRQISGKLVIILDEIDALTKTHYSDQIFAQIRSVYFSRVNYPEFERLTYILSGVVEPADIIKDPKISPFNIGQKIFLNDFSKTEFLNLLTQSNLSLSTEIQERIYFWTNGNPRTTWDICSEVENYLQKYDDITSHDLDKIISDLYLTSHDKPPVDNIRELVKQDREIRNAIVEIHYNNGDKISDKIKNKLYLSGVANYNEDRVEIKNEIIKQSLNLEWIKSIDEEDKGYVRLAVESYAAKDFVSALNYFLKYLQENEFTDTSDKPHYYYMMGFSCYKASDFPTAINYLNLTNFDIDDEPKSFFDTKFLTGLCYTYLDDFDSALLHYRIVLDSGRRDEIYLKSLVNYGSVSLKSKKPELLDQAINIFSEIISDLGLNSPKIKEDKAREVKSIALYNSGVIFTDKGDLDKAKDCFTQAIALSNVNSKPLMTLGLLNIVEDLESKYQLLNELTHQIARNELIPSDFDPENPLQFSLNELKEIAILCFIDFNENLFTRIKEQILLYFNKGLVPLIFDFAIEAINNRNWDNSKVLFQSLVKELNNPEYEFDELKYETIKYASYFNNEVSNYYLFAESFAERKILKVDTIDIANFANLILDLTSSGKYEEALLRIRNINDLRATASQELIIDFLVIDHLELNVYKATANRSKVLEKANLILDLLKNPVLKTLKSNLIGETGLDLIKSNAEGVIHINKQRTPVRILNKYGRNELVKVRYKDGTSILAKYKKIEEDLRTGECTVIDSSV